MSEDELIRLLRDNLHIEVRYEKPEVRVRILYKDKLICRDKASIK